jgi:predicted metal-dependent hydrolase
LDKHEILVGGEPADIGAAVARLLQHEAERHFAALVAAKAALAGVRPTRVVIKDTRSRWGSCTASRVLSFSWRLVMAPRFVQDYVAAHEVAHIRHMNHGRQFWALVEELTPYTDAAVVWLRDEGPRLLRVG